MGPKRGEDKEKGQKTLEFNSQDDQPLWARRMEDRMTASFADLCQNVTLLEQRVERGEKETQAKLKRIEERMTDMEFHNRKYNLLFFGLPTEGPAEVKVRRFLSKDLELPDADSILFHHCHPLPAGRDGKQPVIVRLVNFMDREKILRSLPKLKGKGVKVSVVTDLPKTLRVKRTELQSKMREMRRADSTRFLRVIERGQDVRLEERKGGNWQKIND